MKHDPFDDPRFDYEMRHSCHTGIETIAAVGGLLSGIGSVASIFMQPDAPDTPTVEEPDLKVAAKDTASKQKKLASVRKSTVLTDPLGAGSQDEGGIAKPLILGG